jgi:hypothetical protein
MLLQIGTGADLKMQDSNHKTPLSKLKTHQRDILVTRLYALKKAQISAMNARASAACIAASKKLLAVKNAQIAAAKAEARWNLIEEVKMKINETKSSWRSDLQALFDSISTEHQSATHSSASKDAAPAPSPQASDTPCAQSSDNMAGSAPITAKRARDNNQDVDADTAPASKRARTA